MPRKVPIPFFAISFMLGVVALLGACAMPTPSPTVQEQPAPNNAEQAATVQAIQTKLEEIRTNLTETTQSSPATDTLTQVDTPADAPVTQSAAEIAPQTVAEPSTEPSPEPVAENASSPSPEQRELLAKLRPQGEAPELLNEVWLNSQPLKLADLRGQVVIVEFWTYG